MWKRRRREWWAECHPLPKIHPWKPASLPMLGERDFANVNGYRIMKRDQCGLKVLNQMTSTIIGDTQHTGKHGEALRGRERNLLAHSQPQEYLGETRKTISPGVSLGKSQLPQPPSLDIEL